MVVRREHTNTAPAAKLTAGIGTGVVPVSGDNLSGWPTGGIGPFFIVIGRGTPTEELILCSSRSGNTLTVSARAQGGTTATAHAVNDVVEHIWTALEADEANAHIMASTSVHGIAGSVVGTSDTQVLTGKTIDGAGNTLQNIPYGSIPGLSTDLSARPVLGTVQTMDDHAAPAGRIAMWPGAVAPSWWAICDGSALAVASYPALFAVIGYTYGGSGATFNLPDLRGRQAIGVNGSHALGSTGGAESTTLVIGQVPQHAHAIDHDHVAFNTASGGAHTHTVNTYTGTTATTNGRPQEVSGGTASTIATLADAGHLHSIDVPAFVGTSGNAGSASPSTVPTLDPFLSVNFIIYKGAA
jgi:microcystin-dependent protein